MLADPLQDIDQVGVGIDAMQAAGDDQALDDADVFGTELGPAEDPVLASHGDDSQGALQVVRVDRNIGIGEKDLEPDPAFARIVQSLDERVRAA